MSAYIGESRPIAPGAVAAPITCEYCERRVFVVMPTDVASLAAMIRGFEDLHAECARRLGRRPKCS